MSLLVINKLSNMKNIFFIVTLFCLFPVLVFCQNKNREEMKFKFEESPIVFYNGQIIDIEESLDSALSIGIVLHNNIYKSNSNEQESILTKYIDVNKSKQSIIPVFFIFSEDRVTIIDADRFWYFTENKSSVILFQINDGNFSQKIDELYQLDPNQIDKIQMVKDFKLTRWDTGEKDAFTLFLIKTKK